MLEKLLAPAVQKFIKDHENDDPMKLILQNKTVEDVPVNEVAAQIAARQKAKIKLPEWYGTEKIIYPPLISMEQCSSELTAKYKATLVSGNLLYDLTGGAGVDTYYLSRHFKAVYYVEQHSELANISAHNFSHLGATNISVVNNLAETFLSESAKKADVIYLDPARRDKNAQRVFRLENSVPDVVALLPDLVERAGVVMIKASPMLDINLSIKTLKHVHQVHVISVANECKEVLYLLQQEKNTDPEIVTVNLPKKDKAQFFNFRRSEELKAGGNYGNPEQYLYEPNSSVLKAGAFQLISEKYNLIKLHQNTHLYTSASAIKQFPGRCFKILQILPYQKKAVTPFVPDRKANVTARNFPDDVRTIKKKLKLTDGGTIFIFAFTDNENKKKIAITQKIA